MNIVFQWPSGFLLFAALAVISKQGTCGQRFKKKKFSTVRDFFFRFWSIILFQAKGYARGFDNPGSF